MEFFFPNPVKTMNSGEFREASKERGGILALTISRPDLIDDILYPQMKKFEKNIGQLLETGGFRIMGMDSHAMEDVLVIIAEVESAQLSPAMLHRGPPVTVSENSASFLAKWRNSPDAMSSTFIKDGCWHVFARRKHPRAVSLLESSINTIDAGKNLNAFADTVKVFDEIPEDGLILEALSKYLDKRLPWER
jgi:tRNA nucleotidyltransferase (CCA-adding enzyme)